MRPSNYKSKLIPVSLFGSRSADSSLVNPIGSQSKNVGANSDAPSESYLKYFNSLLSVNPIGSRRYKKHFPRCNRRSFIHFPQHQIGTTKGRLSSRVLKPSISQATSISFVPSDAHMNLRGARRLSSIGSSVSSGNMPDNDIASSNGHFF